MKLAAFSSRLESLNGWQRVWLVFSVLLALVIAGTTAAEWPREPDHGPWERYQTGRVENPFDQFDPDPNLAKTAPATPSGKPRTLESIRLDPDYINANDATKRAIFERWAPTDPSYVAADESMRRAIRQRFGIGEPAQHGEATRSSPSSKYVPEAGLTPEQKAALERAQERLTLSLRDAEDRQRQELKERERAAFAAKMRLVGTAVAQWLIGILGVYALGWSFAWVRRGFRR
jgi:hypothetical protein